MKIFEKRKPISEETRKKLRDSHLGKPGPWRGKLRPGLHSEEWKNAHSKRVSGKNNPMWKGGRKVSNGYVFLYKPNHPFATSNYVPEHRFVMETFLGRYLTSNEIVHHRNTIKDDNRLENLQIVLRTAHRGEVDCPHCGFKFAIR